MTRILQCKFKRGVRYQATIRRKGFETVTRILDTKGEAIIGHAMLSRI